MNVADNGDWLQEKSGFILDFHVVAMLIPNAMNGDTIAERIKPPFKNPANPKPHFAAAFVKLCVTWYVPISPKR